MSREQVWVTRWDVLIWLFVSLVIGLVVSELF